jgi:hypothetical protein
VVHYKHERQTLILNRRIQMTNDKYKVCLKKDNKDYYVIVAAETFELAKSIVRKNFKNIRITGGYLWEL